MKHFTTFISVYRPVDKYAKFVPLGLALLPCLEPPGNFSRRRLEIGPSILVPVLVLNGRAQDACSPWSSVKSSGSSTHTHSNWNPRSTNTVRQISSFDVLIGIASE